jgi:hypothetical protein
MMIAPMDPNTRKIPKTLAFNGPSYSLFVPAIVPLPLGESVLPKAIPEPGEIIHGTRFSQAIIEA